MKRPKQTRRRGFTLVELLVVITILAVLVSLVVAGAFQVVGTQRQNNTEATMRTVMKVLNQHWEHVIAEAKKENMPSAFLALYPGNLDTARKDWINLRLVEAFPKNGKEIDDVKKGLLNYKYLNPKKYNPLYYSKAGISATSSVYLLLALSVSRGGTSLDPDSLGSAQVMDPTTKLAKLVDGWGNDVVYDRDMFLVLPNGTKTPSQYWVAHLISTGANQLDANDDISSDFLGVK